MTNKVAFQKNIIRVTLISILILASLFSFAKTSLAVWSDTWSPPGGTLDCTGYGQGCGSDVQGGTLNGPAPSDPGGMIYYTSGEAGACQKMWVITDKPNFVIKNVWRGGYRGWDDKITSWFKIGGVIEWSDSDVTPGCSCGNGTNCAGSITTLLPDHTWNRSSSDFSPLVPFSIEMGVRGQNFKTGPEPTTHVEDHFGVAVNYCGGGDGYVGARAADCVPLAGTISVSPSTCTTVPCNVTVSWDSNSNDAFLASGRNGIDVYVNGNSLWTHQPISNPGGKIDSGLTNGTYQYCIRGYDGGGYVPYLDGSYFGIQKITSLDCKTVVVNDTFKFEPKLSWSPDLLGPHHESNTVFISACGSRGACSGQDSWQMEVEEGKPDTAVELWRSANGSAFTSLGIQGTTDSSGNLIFPIPATVIGDGIEADYSYYVKVGTDISRTISQKTQDYDISASAIGGLNRGQAGNLPVGVINKTGGFNGDVAFTVTNCPAGATCGTVTASGNAYIVITPGPTTPLGSHSITVRGTYGGHHYREITVSNAVIVTNPARTLIIASTNPASGVAMTGVTTDNSGNGNGSTQFTRTYNDGAAVTITAPVTASGNNFSSWTGCDSVSGVGNRTCNATMSANKTATANYITTPPTLSCSPIPLTVPVNTDGTLYASQGTPPYSWSGGGTPSTGTGSSFTSRWSTTGMYFVQLRDSVNTGLACQVIVTNPARTLIIASTNPASGVAMTGVTTDNSGNGNGSTQFTRTYNDGAAVTITAPVTASGNNFSSWTGCDSVSGVGNRTCNATMSANKTATANYITTRTLIIASTNPASGVAMTGVTTDNSGNGNGSTQFTRTYNDGAAVTITAPVTASGNNFSSWSGCNSTSNTYTCNIVMSANKTATANYAAVVPTYEVDPSSAAIRINNTKQFTGWWDPDGSGPIVRQNATGLAYWSSSDNDIATVNNNGLATCLAAGSVTISSSFNGLPSSAGLTCSIELMGIGIIKQGSGAGTVTSDPGGINCGSSCSADFQYDSGNVIITAVPAPGSYLRFWSGACLGVPPTDSTCPVGTANYVPYYSTNVIIAFDLLLLPDLAAGASSPTTATAGTPVSFTSTISNIGTASTGANFFNFFQRATAANGGGTITDFSASLMGALAAGASNTATSPSYTFTSAGTYSVRACADKSSSGNTGTIPESNENNNCGAWTNVTVSAAPNAVANITANPVNIPYNTPTTLSWSYSGATSCSITPPATTGSYPSDSGSVSTGNLTASRTYTISCDPGGVNSSVTVNVQAQPKDLTVIRSGQGTIISDPVGINCGTGCTTQTTEFPPDAVVRLVAVPNTGRIFTGWSGDCSGKGVCTVTMNGSKTVSANFAIDPNYQEF